MNAKKILPVILLFSIFISCNNKAKKDQLNAMDVTTVALEKQAAPGTFSAYQAAATDSGSQEPPQEAGQQPSPVSKQPVSNPDWDKKIIKTATLRLEVPDFKAYSESVHKTIKQFGGYIAQEEQNLSDEKSETVISIKVPVDQFESMMTQLPAQAAKVLERKITTDDVTGEVVDTKSRLEAKKEMRLKYLEFLKQSKNMAEVLQVQNEINSIQEEMEAAATRINFLTQQASFSTINLTFYQPLPGFKPVDDKEPGFLTKLTLAFKSGVSWFADLSIGLMSIWPLILVMVIALIAWKRSRRVKPVQQNV